MSDLGAGWKHDPTERHEQRYWDGSVWTEHVSDAGHPGTDPIIQGSPIPAASTEQAWTMPAVSTSVKKKPTAALAIVAVAAVTLVLIGIGAAVLLLSGSSSSSNDVQGSVELTGYDSSGGTDTRAGGSCFGVDGYEDLDSGTQVRISNQDGKVIATGELDEGRYTDRAADVCRFDWVLSDVPSADIYTMEVSHRGELSYSQDELEQSDWRMDSSIGDD